MVIRAYVAFVFSGIIWAAPPNSEILKILRDRVETTGQGIGMVAGIVEPEGRRVVPYGTFSKDDPRMVDGSSLFEIGSMTKVFTSLVLADMVQRGEVSLDDPVAKYLPEQVHVPQRGGRQITLQDLSMHRSGFPKLPPNFLPKVVDDPYSDYTASRLYEFLSGFELTRDIGSKFEYSNLGVGLLGHALSRRAGLDYEQLVKSRILDPLGLKSSGVTLSSDLRARLTRGHDINLRPVPYWTWDVLAGAGALHSDVNDILTLLSAFLGHEETPLQGAMQGMLIPRSPADGTGEVALAWQVVKGNDGEIIWHSGGTGGFRSFMGFDKRTRVGVVILSNTATDVETIGLRLLGAIPPQAAPSKQRTEISIDPNRLDAFVGTYEIGQGVNLTITREANQLFAQLTGQSKYPIFAEGDRNFFYKVVDAQITFEVGDSSRANSLMLHQTGRDDRASRVETRQRRTHTEVAIDPGLLDSYTGRYQINNIVMTITRDGNRLFAQLTGEPKFGIFPQADRDFFYRAVDAEIHFEPSKGAAQALTLVQPPLTLNGVNAELRFLRVE